MSVCVYIAFDRLHLIELSSTEETLYELFGFSLPVYIYLSSIIYYTSMYFTINVFLCKPQI